MPLSCKVAIFDKIMAFMRNIKFLSWITCFLSHNGLNFVVDADFDLAWVRGCDAILRDFAVLPFDVHSEIATRAQTFDAALLPVFGQGRQEVDFTEV
jgi:hypothetical protein